MRIYSPRTPLLVIGILLLMLAGVLVLSTIATAQVPQQLSYQGVITDAGGQPLEQVATSMSFAIYDSPEGGAILWSETQPDVAVKRGLFNVTLGSTIGIALPFDKPYWLGTTIGSGPELSPRMKLASSPYSLHSHSADSAQAVAVNTISAINLKNGAVTPSKIDASGSASGQVLISTGSGVTWGTIPAAGITSINGQTGTVEILGGQNVTIARSGNRFTIDAPGGGGGVNSGITSLNSGDAVVQISNPTGPNAFISLAPGSIGGSLLATGAVGTSQIQTGSVTGDKIADGSIITMHLADNSVTSSKIVDAQVMTSDIADLNVTGAKLSTGAVTNDKIADNSISSSKIIDGQVQTSDIGANAVSASKIDATGASTGMALIANGSGTPLWGNPSASDLILPFSRSQGAAGTLLSITNSDAGSAGNFTISNSGSPAHAMTASTNGSGFAARFTGTGTSAHGVSISAGPSQKGLEIAQGRVVLSYAAVAHATTIGTGVAVVEVQNNGTAMSQAQVTLPDFTLVENGTTIIIATSDPDGAVVFGTAGQTYDIPSTESRTFIRISNGWKGDY